ncbi:MAG: 3-hydroxyacyl-CoA dehydrogenase family protein [Geminicoccaceae bacterium]|nr:3-hydroxyacyl-CoA dehydrogenase family protein [Geminicoccaceae bacterium]MCX7629181.1 3-hydroxyacyl-CoA dehydrogenase family protein [Geminicoccaceae bacterium]MDW8123703.1 3-hydroxyacyl-CoA dehydrogenase family protein [Geminicoccaceae bacterium]
MREIRTVGIVGTGTMGTGIATNLAQHGIAVRLFDVRPEQAKSAVAQAQAFWARSVERGRLSAEAAAAAATRLAVVGSLAELAACDLVIEAIFEDFTLKARLFEELSGLVPEDALVATNTSCLRVSDLARHMRRPERFLGLHYFSPAQINPIVEVVRGEATAAETIAAALAFCRATGKKPITCKDSYGFAINRFFCPYTNEACRLLDEGLATTAEIDAVAEEAVGAAAGPFRVQNLIKPRINLHAIRNLAPLGPFYAPARSLIEVGEADRSFEIGEAGEIPPERRARIRDRLRMGVFVAVLQELDEEVAAPADIDLGAREALRFSKPPCALMDELGGAEVERIVRPALERYGLARPAALDRVGRLSS